MTDEAFKELAAAMISLAIEEGKKRGREELYNALLPICPDEFKEKMKEAKENNGRSKIS